MCVCVHVCVCMYVRKCMCVDMHVCMCVYFMHVWTCMCRCANPHVHMDLEARCGPWVSSYTLVLGTGYFSEPGAHPFSINWHPSKLQESSLSAAHPVPPSPGLIDTLLHQNRGKNWAGALKSRLLPAASGISLMVMGPVSVPELHVVLCPHCLLKPCTHKAGGPSGCLLCCCHHRVVKSRGVLAEREQRLEIRQRSWFLGGLFPTGRKM